MNKQTVSFKNTPDSSVITRTIVYLPTISQQEIIQYFLSSISRDCSVEVGEIESCICYFESQELTTQIECHIDKHWIDGTIHLMLNKNTQKEELIVLSTYLDEKERVGDLKEQDQLIYVNTLEDCWIKRKGSEYA